MGARAIAMGEAHAALADDASSLYWNPAGLAILNQSHASFMYNSALDDLSINRVAVATPLEFGGLGASLTYESYGKINGFDRQAHPTGDVSAYTAVGTFGGGLLAGPWAFGMSIKPVQEHLADVSALGVAFDLGAVYTHQVPVYDGTIRAGLTIRNLGTGLKFLQERDPFPREYRLGLTAVQLFEKRLNLAMDWGKERNVPGALYTGVEVWPYPLIALRTGYAGTRAEGSGLRAGVGLRVRDFMFDYAYSSYGDLGFSHRYELGLRFAGLRPVLTPAERELLRRGKRAMAEGRYEEAVMLFDTLIDLAPQYRPVRRLVKVAMRGAEMQQQAQDEAGRVVLSAERPSQEDHELTNLLQQAEEVQEAAATGEKLPDADESTLAPYVPAPLNPENPQ